MKFVSSDRPSIIKPTRSKFQKNAAQLKWSFVLATFASAFTFSLGSDAGSAWAAPVRSNGSVQDENTATETLASESPASEPNPVAMTADQSSEGWVVDNDDLFEGNQRAWEYRPYRVAVWICDDGSPQLTTTHDALCEELTQRAELIDPSGWNLHFGHAPSKYRSQFLKYLNQPELVVGFEQLSTLKSYDKLIVVCLQQEYEFTKIAVRECDLTTLQWGPLQKRNSGYFSQLVTSTMDAICKAFMPITRIDRVDLKGPETEVFLQIRAAESCIRLILNEAKEWTVVKNPQSPVYIKPEDRFLPVIRHMDRDGKLLKLQPIELTFLSLQRSGEEGQLVCRVTSSQRAPLAGRRSRTAERFALVIRPTSEPSTLIVRGREKNKVPVGGVKVYSIKPGVHEIDEKSQAPEYLGKTDWQGRIEIPPSDDGIRMLLLGRGGRSLLRMPIIPGLYPEISVEIQNDETSLYAEGVFRGFESEILNLIIQRDVLEAEINSLLNRNDLAAANEKLKAYRALESPVDIEHRMSSETTQLEAAATGTLQRKTISNRFQELKGILSQRAGVTKLSELEAKIQVKANVPGAVENPAEAEE